MHIDQGEELMSLHAATRRFQRDLVQRALDRCQQNVSAAARALKITRAHMYNLMATFGLRREVRLEVRSDVPSDVRPADSDGREPG
jgi:DNA-binding NtrC family response regulator